MRTNNARRLSEDDDIEPVVPRSCVKPGRPAPLGRSFFAKPCHSCATSTGPLLLQGFVLCRVPSACLPNPRPAHSVQRHRSWCGVQFWQIRYTFAIVLTKVDSGVLKPMQTSSVSLASQLEVVKRLLKENQRLAHQVCNVVPCLHGVPLWIALKGRSA